MYRQDDPFCVQVELTEGCNLRCEFCGLQGIREKSGGPYKFMSVETALHVAQGIHDAGWNPRIEFAMHGEPSMNPNAAPIISLFRKWLPKAQLMMTSNGGGFLKEPAKNISALFQSGLNVLALDDYQSVNIVPRVRTRLNCLYPVKDYPKDGLEYSPHRRWPHNTQIIIIVEDISKAGEGTHASLNNHCGAGSPLNDRGVGKRCAKPFRELSVRWDGSVAGCCNDWRGLYKVGTIRKPEDVEKVWYSPLFHAMRVKLYHGQRDFGPCKGCDALSYRVGLLPDHKGLIELPEPDAEVLQNIKKALRGQPYTEPVLRPWEEK